jgi:proline dehydrogenase
VLPSLILAAADSPRLRRFVDQYGMRLDAARFVGGETLDQVVVTLRGLNEQGPRTNTSLLGEHVAEPAEAEQVRPAARLGNFVRIDMEDSSLVDATLGIYRRLRESGHDNVGTVLQAYLYRTPRDLEPLLPLRPNLRIVKGAYEEPASVAHGRRPTSTPPTTGWSSDPSRSRHSRRSQRTTSGGSRRRWRSGAGPTGWSSRCSTASGRSSSSTSSARAGGCWSRLPSAPTGTRT